MQPEFVKHAARTTNSASEGLDILRMYEHDYQEALKATQEAAPEVTTEPEEDTTEADKLKSRRAQRLATTVSPASKPAGSETDTMSGDHETMFNAMWSKPSRNR
mgnify:FL=1